MACIDSFFSSVSSAGRITFFRITMVTVKMHHFFWNKVGSSIPSKGKVHKMKHCQEDSKGALDNYICIKIPISDRNGPFRVFFSYIYGTKQTQKFDILYILASALKYCKVASSKLSRLVEHSRIFRLLTLKSLISMEFFLFFLRKISQLHALLEPPRLFIFGEKSHLHDY